MNRDNRFDILKAILILLVVFGHTPRVGIAAEGITNTIRVIYTFHVSLFFFVSGYFLSLERLSWEKILRHLVVPYMVAGVAYYLAGYLFCNEALPLNVWLWRALTRSVGGASWFLCTLIWMHVILWVFKSTRALNRLCAVCTIGAFVLYKLVVAVEDQYLYFAGEVCFLLGVFLHGEDIVAPLIKASPVSFVVFVVLIFGKLTSLSPFFQLQQVDWLLRLTALSLLLAVSEKLNGIGICRAVFCYLGRSTLIVFLIHSLFGRAFFDVVNRACAFEKTGILFSIISTIVVVLSCLAVKEAWNGAKKLFPRC